MASCRAGGYIFWEGGARAVVDGVQSFLSVFFLLKSSVFLVPGHS